MFRISAREHTALSHAISSPRPHALDTFLEWIALGSICILIADSAQKSCGHHRTRLRAAHKNDTAFVGRDETI